MRKLSRPLAEALDYLSALGWEELRLGASAAPAAAGAEAARPSGSAAHTEHSEPSEPSEPLETPGHSEAAAPPDSAAPDARARELDQLRQQAMACRSCSLCEKRRSVVFGTGPVNAPLMFIGEGPGANEDLQGLPFVGEAGGLLNKIIGAMGLERERVYIANVVKCRPPGNRDPLPAEVAACRPFLEGQIDLVRPRVLVVLGRVAANALLGTSETLKSMRGRWYQVRGVPTMVTYHPAAMLRNSGYKRPAWEDFQVARDRLLDNSQEEGK